MTRAERRAWRRAVAALTVGVTAAAVLTVVTEAGRPAEAEVACAVYGGGRC